VLLDKNADVSRSEINKSDFSRRDDPHSHLGLQLANPRIRAHCDTLRCIYLSICSYANTFLQAINITNIWEIRNIN